MKVALLKSITTEEALTALEAEGKKYDGLYVDMEDKKQRKFVKDGAANIAGLIKKVDRARIDLAKDYRSNIEAEAKSITERLETANAPFSSLIDAYNEKRKAILAEEKRIADEVEQARLAKIAQDLRDEHHEMAILMMAEDFRQRAEEAEQERLDKIAHDEAIALEATQKAEREAKEAIAQAEADKQAAIAATKLEAEKAKIYAAKKAAEERKQFEDDKIAAAKKAEADRQEAVEDEKQRVAEEQKRIADDLADREADTKHRGNIHSEILAFMVAGGIEAKKAKGFISSLSKGDVPHTGINY